MTRPGGGPRKEGLVTGPVPLLLLYYLHCTIFRVVEDLLFEDPASPWAFLEVDGMEKSWTPIPRPMFPRTIGFVATRERGG